MTDPALAHALATGEQAFARVGCARCHIPSLPLGRAGWKGPEPGPYNPPGNARREPGTRLVTVDLTDPRLPEPRLLPSSSTALTVDVPAFTDFKLHDITDPADKDAAEPLDINQPTTSRKFWRATVVS